MKYIFLCVSVLSVVYCDVLDNEVDTCNVPQTLKDEISSYAKVVDRIINECLIGSFRNFTYDKLATFIDKFGYRMAGTQNLEDSIDYMLAESALKNLENVHGEELPIPHWVRGNESATLISPRYQHLAILGLGSSVGTPPDGIKAEAIVVKSFEELAHVASKVRGKIVVFNPSFISYGETVKYRSHGASKAAPLGAVATLVRSITPFSLYTPHTGWQDYSDDAPKIPSACITVEDANMMERMQNRGQKLVVELKMEANNLPPSTSRNVVVEIEGSVEPEKVVIVSGHIDSWDVGQGAQDDGGGVFVGWSAAVLLKQLGLRPKRTIRVIMWTAEEEGLVGANEYVKQHSKEMPNINFVMESDLGTYTPRGLEYTGPLEGYCILQEVLKLLAPIDSTEIVRIDSVGSDITVFLELGLPGADLLCRNERYFDIHHSNADTMDLIDSTDLDKITALWAAVAYIVADLSTDMPKNISNAN